MLYMDDGFPTKSKLDINTKKKKSNHRWLLFGLNKMLNYLAAKTLMPSKSTFLIPS